MPTLTQIAEGERLRANAANEARYQQALTEMQSARQRMTSLFASARAGLATQGQQAGVDIDVGAAGLQAQQRQQLMTAGLANTTVMGAMGRGVETDRTAAQARLREGVAAQQAGLMTQQATAEMGGAQALTGLIGSKQDVGPDLGQYAGLARAAAGGPSPWQASGGGGDMFARLGFRDEGGGGGGGGAPTQQNQAQTMGKRGGWNPEDAAAAGSLRLPGAGNTLQASTTPISRRVSRYSPAFGALREAGKLTKRQSGYYT